jgi:hypothetical protein
MQNLPVKATQGHCLVKIQTLCASPANHHWPPCRFMLPGKRDSNPGITPFHARARAYGAPPQQQNKNS